MSQKEPEIISEVRRDLILNADDKTKGSSERFFKEAVDPYGVKSAVVEQIAKGSLRKISHLGKEMIFDLCEILWRSGKLEESFIACNWSYAVRERYERTDFALFERWVETYVTNWASCDTFCNHTMGSLIDHYPDLLAGLKKWSLSSNRWVKRGSAVSLIIPARQGKFLTDIFEISDIMLTDRDDMVQKGYGWMLKAASQAHQQEVFDYVMRNKKIMPRTSLRYAIEKMPADMKRQAMEK